MRRMRDTALKEVVQWARGEVQFDRFSILRAVAMLFSEADEFVDGILTAVFVIS